MKRVLITGGPVHAHLDAVKVITNGFRGGFMSDLANRLGEYDIEVVYLCAPKVGAKIPQVSDHIEVVTHSGFDDYRRKVLELAPSMDGVVLGAAVANLVPVNPWKGKFPSHNYRPGDIIPIDFMIAPRVIDEVKKVAPNTHLFGFKLLSGVGYDELIGAAYGIVLEARATAVFANDAQNLEQKWAVTKERGVHPMRYRDLALWIAEMLDDVYYSTAFDNDLHAPDKVIHRVRALIEMFSQYFLAVETGLVFGTVAVRHGNGFVTTGRGKRELDSIAHVTMVDHQARKVYAAGTEKASLNAPLLSRMFENPDVEEIVHFHSPVEGIPIYPYAPPGTVRDSERPNKTSFYIQGHGSILLFDKDGRRL